MIKIETTSGGKAISVRGSSAEVMLFYCFWQTSLWPDWMTYEKLGDRADVASKQHRGVIDRINRGDDLILYDSGEMFEKACRFACEQCTALGVDVQQHAEASV